MPMSTMDKNSNKTSSELWYDGQWKTILINLLTIKTNKF